MWVEMTLFSSLSSVALSSSSWGCELKCFYDPEHACIFIVILFVRMWVEISKTGMELNYNRVILFVRMWVEIMAGDERVINEASSSSSWGCELKCNSEEILSCQRVILFVRMWVEIYFGRFSPHSKYRHPLREDVSWNLTAHCRCSCDRCHPLREDVSWNGNELHNNMKKLGHPLREDVSWNFLMLIDTSNQIVILFVRMWVEISHMLSVR